MVHTPVSLVAMHDRRFKGSTELYFYLLCGEPAVCLDVGDISEDGHPVMRLVLRHVGDEVLNGIKTGIYQLAGHTGLQHPAPYPTVSLSGVLWHRQAMISGS